MGEMLDTLGEDFISVGVEDTITTDDISVKVSNGKLEDLELSTEIAKSTLAHFQKMITKEQSRLEERTCI